VQEVHAAQYIVLAGEGANIYARAQ
jgi:hypothetical protein